jgi:hypothetical protein
VGVGRRDGAEPGPTHCISVPRHVPGQYNEATQPMTVDVDIMLIHIFTRDIRDQPWREELIMNRSDRLAKSGAGGIIANTQMRWVPADRRRFCIPCKANERKVCIQTA